MSLLTLVQDACRLMGLPVLTSVVSNTSAQAQSMYAQANAALYELRTLKVWPQLDTEATITTVVDQAEYDLPADFQAMISDTAMDRTSFRVLRGGLTPQEWQLRKTSLVNPALFTGFRIIGYSGKITLDPTPSSEQTLAYEYRSKYPVLASDETAKSAFTADDDTCKLDETLVKMGLMWRYRRSKGFDYGEDFREYYRTVDMVFAQAKASPTVYITPNEYDYGLIEPVVPDTGFGA